MNLLSDKIGDKLFFLLLCFEYKQRVTLSSYVVLVYRPRTSDYLKCETHKPTARPVSALLLQAIISKSNKALNGECIMHLYLGLILLH